MIKLVSVLMIFTLSQITFAAQDKKEKTEPKLVDVDLSGSTGNYNGVTYSEIHMGINFNFSENLTWRNSGFKRIGVSGNQDFSGLDTSLRYTVDTPFDEGAVKLFAGPGYRWASASDKNAVFAEAGVGLSAGPFNLSAGSKYLRYDKSQFDANGVELKRDDTSYFVTISAGTKFKF